MRDNMSEFVTYNRVAAACDDGTFFVAHLYMYNSKTSTRAKRSLLAQLSLSIWVLVRLEIAVRRVFRFVA